MNISKEKREKTSALHYLSLVEVGKLIAEKKISPVELTQMMLERIDVLDRQLKSYAVVTANQAMDAARVAEKQIMSGNYLGPLHGIPVAVKDLCYTKGVPTVGGLKVLDGFVPGFDATVIAGLKAAGAVMLGKLNLTEGAMGGYHRDFEVPVNPWDETLWTGASSSGSGVATAAGMCFAALGTDTGGSIRFPATANGIVGFKPTYGLVSRYGVLPLAGSLDHVGPMTRSVADAAIVLEAIAGFDPGDPTSLKSSVTQIPGQFDGDLRGVRIGFDRDYALKLVDSALALAIENAVRTLEELGAEIVEVKVPDVSAALAAWPVICSSEALLAHRANYPARSGEYGEFFREFLEFGANVSEKALADAYKIKSEFSRKFRTMLMGVDAIVSPASGTPFAISRQLQYGSMTELNKAFTGATPAGKHADTFTIPLDFAGTPGLALPCGMSGRGIPYTMQLSGRFLGESMLCRIGHAYEKATCWHDKHPPV